MCIHFRMMVKLALVPAPNQCGNETGQLLASFHALRHSPVSVLLAFGENGGEGGGGPGRFCELQQFSTTPSVYLTSLHMTKSPSLPPLFFAYCKQSKTGGEKGMGIIRLCVFDSFCMLVNSCFVLTAPNIVRCDVWDG